MATVMLKGTPIHTSGELPTIGTPAPDFQLVAADLKDRHLADFADKKKLLNIVPSLDTPVCALSTRKFNDYAKDHADTVILVISADLPFAQKRFCGNENLINVVTLSLLRSPDFAEKYGVLLQDGPLAGLTARAVIVLDETDTVIYTELAPEIAQEPDYDAALAALK